MSGARVLDAAAVRRWLSLAEQALGAASASIDDLNVFPVPDADTGTNLHGTVACAAAAAAALPDAASPGQLWSAATAAALTGACGNSGIIFSQLLRGLAEVCADAVPCDGEALASGLRNAAGLARRAVRRPVEGTVLTVADAAAAAARGPGLAEVAAAAAAGARQALERTSQQLAVLAANGVVDAGGAALCVVLDALCAAVAGPGTAIRPPVVPPRAAVARPRTAAARAAYRGPDRAARLGAGSGPAPLADGQVSGYEVMFMLDAADAAASELADQLDELGDSLVISGGDGRWHVHVHVADAGAAIELAQAGGGLSRIAISYLGVPGAPPTAAAAGGGPELNSADTAPAGATIATAGHRAIVVAEGAALADLVGLAGGLAVPVDSAVQAVAALAVHDPRRDPEADAAAMARAAAAMRHGIVEGGQVCTGRAGGELVATGTAAQAPAAVTAALVTPETELVTVIRGAGAAPELADLVTASARAISPEAEVCCYDGGSTSAVLLIGAE